MVHVKLSCVGTRLEYIGQGNIRKKYVNIHLSCEMKNETRLSLRAIQKTDWDIETSKLAGL